MIPALLAAVPLLPCCRGVKVYEVFCDGAREGFEIAVRLLPYLVAMFVASASFGPPTPSTRSCASSNLSRRPWASPPKSSPWRP